MLAVASPDAAPRFDGNQGKPHADNQIDGEQNRHKEGVDEKGQHQRDAGQQNHGEKRADGVRKEKFNGFNVGNGNVEDVALLPVHQAGGSQLAQSDKQVGAHVREQRVGAGVGDHTLNVTAQDNQKGAQGG